MPRGVFWFIFNLRIKKMGSITYIHIMTVISLFTSTRFVPSHTLLYTNLSNQGLAAPQQMSPSLHLSQSILSLFTRHMGRKPHIFPSMAWLGCFFSLACPDLPADHHPITNTSHRYGSLLKQFGYSATVQVNTFTTF
jgi:hypothetical protein